jgi:predicted dehydrogenase
LHPEHYDKEVFRSMPLRVAILGCGAVTNVLYCPALKEVQADIELVGAADLNRVSAQNLLKEFPQTKFFSDYRQMLAEVRPDAAIVALPHAFHKAASIDAMRLGIDVFCEKPMALNSGECDEIESVVRETGRVWAANMFRRLFPSLKEIKRLIGIGAFGTPRAFEITEGAPYGWPAMSFSFFDRKIAGGGVLMDSGVHTLDLIQWLLGDVSVAEFFDDASAEGVECDCVANLTAGSARGSLRMSRSVTMPNVYRLEFEHGWIEWDHDDGTQFRFSVDGGETVKAEVQCDPCWGRGGRFVYALAQQLRNFAKACHHQPAESVVTAAEARKSVDTITQCYANRSELVITR